MQKKYNLHSLQKRILAIVVLISLIFCAIFIRLFIVQIINGKELQLKATEQWTRDLPLAAERGKIYDANGAALAVSYSTYNVYTRGREIEDANEVALYLSQKLDLRFQPVFDKVSEKGVSEMLIKMQIEEDIAKEIIEKGYKGVYLSENNKRYYPYGDLLTQVLGFTTIDNAGQAGIEAYFNEYLKGVDGYTYLQSDLQGHEIEGTIRDYVPAIPGLNIDLTIDSKLQLIVEQTLNKAMLEQKAKSATAIIMDVETGDILAMSSKPSFDLNNVPRDDVGYLMESVKNKAVVDVYEPGSTFKILTIASALEMAKTTLDDRFYCAGSRLVDGQKIKCWRSIGHGSQNLIEGFGNSCNCVFMDLALRMGKNNFYDYLKAFGLGSQTGIDISGESKGILMNKDSVKNVDLARIGFGQAVAVTPLQLITSASAVMGGGELLQPNIIKKIYDEQGNIALERNRKVIRRVVSKETAGEVNGMLEFALSKAGKNTWVAGYPIGGKTGTAQKYENGAIARGKYISSFVGSYPANNPKYSLLLLVDEPGAGAYYGSVVAAPYAKEIFSGLFTAFNIKPETEIKELKDVYMPSVVDLSLYDATVKIVESGLNYELDGEGDKIIAQLPPAGTKLKEGDTVVIITS